MSYGDMDIKSNGKFLRIESGVPHDVRILDADPVEKIIHGFGKEATNCIGEDCPRCDEGSEPSQRFLTNVYDHTFHKVMLWEFGASIAKQLRSIDQTMREEGKTILNTDLKVEATGEMKNKKYMITLRMTPKLVPTGLTLHKIDTDLGF